MLQGSQTPSKSARTIAVSPYRPELAGSWNHFLKGSKNGTFLFHRDYIDYHADRFRDSSLVVHSGARNLVAILPASSAGTVVSSHAGLSYGGFVIDHRMTMATMLEVFETSLEHFRAIGMSEFLYKRMPACYHRGPADEDLYCLFRADARLLKQDLSSVIDLSGDLTWSKGKRHALSKARRSGVSVAESDDVIDFVDCLREVLAKHGVSPVHSTGEIRLLMGRFPEQIKLFRASLDGRALAYVLVFDCGQTVHTQYMATRAEGRDIGALDIIVAALQSDLYRDRKYLSFGISTEEGGWRLNEGLIGQKEMFGGRPIVHSQYRINLQQPHVDGV